MKPVVELPNPDLPVVKAMTDKLGKESYTYLCQLLALREDIGHFELTPQLLASTCKLNSQKVGRIFEEISKKFEESCKIVQTLGGQNPHGSTHAQKVKPVSPSEKVKSNLLFVPTDFQITERIGRWATENGFTRQEMVSEIPQFVDYHQARGTRYKCWESAFKTWMRNTRKWKSPQTSRFKTQAQMNSADCGEVVL